MLPVALALLLWGACRKIQDGQTTITTFQESGLDVSWDRSGSNRIAFSKKGSDGYYDIYTALPDGSHETCLTCNNPALPNKHICCPSWHPGGHWIIFLAEKSTHPGSSTDALPGFGAYCDIWLMNDSATKFYKLIDLPADADHGVISPHFSPDGRHIEWTNRKKQPDLLNAKGQAGFWNICIAPFHFDSLGLPVVGVTQTIEPGEDAFNECYGYAPDGSKLIFCSCIGQNSFWDEHIYTIDTLGGHLTRLTDKDYNEHAFYTPDGGRICWMSNTNSKKGGTDWWMMNADGNHKQQITFFNEPRHSQYAGHAVWAGLGSFSPDGSRFVGGVQQSLITQEGKIVLVQLN